VRVRGGGALGGGRPACVEVRRWAADAGTMWGAGKGVYLDCRRAVGTRIDRAVKNAGWFATAVPRRVSIPFRAALVASWAVPEGFVTSSPRRNAVLAALWGIMLIVMLPTSFSIAPQE
jgi:hypothetical protein